MKVGTDGGVLDRRQVGRGGVYKRPGSNWLDPGTGIRSRVKAYIYNLIGRRLSGHMSGGA